MLVAEGAVDIAAEPELEVYDMAALDVIVREAGGSFTSLDGTPGPYGGNALASNGRLHDQALAFLGAAADDEVGPRRRPSRARLGARAQCTSTAPGRTGSGRAGPVGRLRRRRGLTPPSPGPPSPGPLPPRRPNQATRYGAASSPARSNQP